MPGSPKDIHGSPSGHVGQTGHEKWLSVAGSPRDVHGSPSGHVGQTGHRKWLSVAGSPKDVHGSPSGHIGQTGVAVCGWESQGCPRESQWTYRTDRTHGTDKTWC